MRGETQERSWERCESKKSFLYIYNSKSCFRLENIGGETSQSPHQPQLPYSLKALCRQTMTPYQTQDRGCLWAGAEGKPTSTAHCSKPLA